MRFFHCEYNYPYAIGLFKLLLKYRSNKYSCNNKALLPYPALDWTIIGQMGNNIRVFLSMIYNIAKLFKSVIDVTGF